MTTTINGIFQPMKFASSYSCKTLLITPCSRKCTTEKSSAINPVGRKLFRNAKRKMGLKRSLSKNFQPMNFASSYRYGTFLITHRNV